MRAVTRLIVRVVDLALATKADSLIELLGDEYAKSDVSRITKGLAHPMPLFQAPLKTRIGTVFPDFLWPEHRLVEEKIREDAVRETGHRVLRWMGAEPMLRPDELIGRIARTLGH